MKPKDFADFRSQMTPHLQHVKSDQRDSLLKALYELATSKTQLESLMEGSSTYIGEDRRRAKTFRRMNSHLAQAHKNVLKARQCLDKEDERFYLMTDMFERLLTTLEDALHGGEELQKLTLGEIHPELRTPHEIQLLRGEKYPEFGYPGSGVYFPDHRFIEKADRLLDKFRTAEGKRLPSVEYDRIISKTFLAAFGEVFNEARVKTIRYRPRKRPPSDYKLPPF
jgi:hypothetical protein